MPGLGYFGLVKTLGRENYHGLIGNCMEGSRVIVGDLDGFGMESKGQGLGESSFWSWVPGLGEFFSRLLALRGYFLSHCMLECT